MSKPAKEEDQQPVQERGHWSKKVRRPSFQGKPNRVALKCAVLYEELPTLVGDYSTIKNMKIVGSIVVYKFYRLPKKERECFSEDSSARNDGDASRSTTIDIEQKEDN